jgi:hypothetical protein
VACAKPATGSPWTVALQYIVAATAGHDFNMSVLNITVSDVVWDAVSQKLYALVPGYSPVNSNTITQIEPSTGTIERSVSMGNLGVIPGTLAISDDGQYLYAGVGLTASTQGVQRVLVSSLTLDTNVALPSQQFISAIRVAPGLPQTTAVLLSNPLPPSVAVYDNATQRTHDFSPADVFAWGADATSAFAFDSGYPATGTVYQLSVSSSGFATSQSTGGITVASGTGSSGFLYSNQNLYWSDGSVFSTTTDTQLKPFVMIPSTPNSTFTTGAMAVDPSADRAYFLNSFQPPGQTGANVLTLESFKSSDRTPLWLAHFPSQNYTFVLTRWGSNGLALTTSGGNQTLVLISGPVVTK